MSTTLKNTKAPKKGLLSKRKSAKKPVRHVDVKVFVRDFYQIYGKMMSQLSHE